MAILGSLTLIDAYGRAASRQFEMVDATLADAGTDLTSLRTALTAISDAGYTAENLTEKTTLSVAATAGANIDAGVSVRVRLDDGSVGVIKIPAPKAAKINADGTIDPADADLVALGNLLGMDEPTTPAVATIYNGKKVTSILSAKLDR
jgi:hypothetical protein